MRGIDFYYLKCEINNNAPPPAIPNENINNNKVTDRW